MKKIILCLAALLVQPTSASIGEAKLELAGYLSAWTQECPGGKCALPVPGERNRPVALTLTLPTAPGEAAAASADAALALAGGEIKAGLGFYAICPYSGKDGTCPGRYFQAQVLVSGPAGASCTAALNAADVAPFPVLTCAGIGADGRRYGVTLHRRPF